jgi:hypothetical protein
VTAAVVVRVVVAQVNSLQAGLREKDGLLQRAVADAEAAEGRRKEAAAKLAEASRCEARRGVPSHAASVAQVGIQ